MPPCRFAEAAGLDPGEASALRWSPMVPARHVLRVPAALGTTPPEMLARRGSRIDPLDGRDGTALARLRQASGLTVWAVSRRARLRPTAVFDLESGRAGEHSLDRVARYAAAVGVQVEDAVRVLLASGRAVSATPPARVSYSVVRDEHEVATRAIDAGGGVSLTLRTRGPGRRVADPPSVDLTPSLWSLSWAWGVETSAVLVVGAQRRRFPCVPVTAAASPSPRPCWETVTLPLSVEDVQALAAGAASVGEVGRIRIGVPHDLQECAGSFVELIRSDAPKQ